MSSDFLLEPLPIEPFLELFAMEEEELLREGSRWLIAETKPGYPCRVSLADADPGDRVLATSFVHHDVTSPYRASGPVFVREVARPAQPAINEIPLMFEHRLLSLRAYDSDGMMLTANIVQGTDLQEAIVECFQDRRVEYQHIHNAHPGCYNCSVRRA